ncbi:hypothetical protein [Reichenbachiella sp. MALMAid0571]|uniref:hypothetical protein n=1 Tax=Reichenbachiella sp. MALMAid0571 TaxID=3143939 RepID=UPI0032DF4E2F
MKQSFFLVFIFLFTSMLPNGLSAQDEQGKKKEVFFGIEPSAYKGDLSDSFEKWSMVFHVGIKFNRFKKMNGNFVLTIGSVTGQNINYSYGDGSLPTPSPNRFFTTKVVGLNYELHYNFINCEKIKVYASQGIGVLRFNPQDEFNNSLVDQLFTRSSSETYGTITLMLPTQIGVLYTLPNQYSVGMQAGFVNTLTDYLDNISAWGSKKGNDNILSVKFEIHIPVSF